MNGKCPACVTVPLITKFRSGVELDVCPACHGMWLQRGELEKLIAQTTDEMDGYYAQDREPPSSRPGRHGRYPKRKRSLMESLGDIFD